MQHQQLQLSVLVANEDSATAFPACETLRLGLEAKAAPGGSDVGACTGAAVSSQQEWGTIGSGGFLSFGIVATAPASTSIGTGVFSFGLHPV